MNTWRAGCGESRTSGSEGGPEKRTGGNSSTALRSDPYTYVATWSGFAYAAFVTDVEGTRPAVEECEAGEVRRPVRVREDFGPAR
jgi:hypothetical protein